MKSHSFFSTLLIFGLAFQHASSFTIAVDDEPVEPRKPSFPHPPNSVEFKRWLQVQGERTVEKIMDKITSPNDTMQQYEAKVAVARYLVNVTFAAMTRRLNLGKSIQIPETAYIPATSELRPSYEVYNETILPATSEGNIETIIAATSEGYNETMFAATSEEYNETMPEMKLDIQSENETTNGTSDAAITATSTDTSTTTSTTFAPMTTEEMIQFLLVLGGGNPSSPVEAIPASAPINGTAAENGTETTTAASRPIWEELLTFNFSSAFSGGGPSNLLNLSRLTGGEGGGASNLFNLSRLTGSAGSEGGSSLFNLSRFSGGSSGVNNLFNLTRLSGGNGTSSLFNLTRLSGGDGTNNLFNLTRFSGGNGAGSFFNLSRLSGGGGAGLSSLFNFGGSGAQAEGNDSSASTNMSMTPEIGALPFVLPTPPEGFLNFPTPPPMNDSVRVSQMYLGNQVEKLVGDINQSNLTGVVDSTINIATPSTIGVLVNALLNIVLCNPLDRWNGNCGV